MAEVYGWKSDETESVISVMPPGKKYGGKDFVKGDKRCGRPKNPPGVARVERITRQSIQDMINEQMNMSPDQLRAVIKDPKSSIMKVATASILIKAAAGSDQNRLEFLITQLVGKPPEPPKVQLNFTMQRLEEMPTGELVELGKDAIKFLESGKGIE